MDSIRIDTGVKRIAINDDPERVIEFNPGDVNFVDRFYQLIGEFEETLVRYEARAKEIDAQQAVDARGVPVNAKERIDFLRESCTFLRDKIDQLFGAGTSQKAFGDALVLETYGQFFEGITPFIRSAREERLAKYAPKTGKKRVMKT